MPWGARLFSVGGGSQGARFAAYSEAFEEDPCAFSRNAVCVTFQSHTAPETIAPAGKSSRTERWRANVREGFQMGASKSNPFRPV
jgi:hypothetical protein